MTSFTRVASARLSSTQPSVALVQPVKISVMSAGLAPNSLCHAYTLQMSGLPGSSRLMRCGSVTMPITSLSISSSVLASVMALP